MLIGRSQRDFGFTVPAQTIDLTSNLITLSPTLPQRHIRLVDVLGRLAPKSCEEGREDPRVVLSHKSKITVSAYVIRYRARSQPPIIATRWIMYLSTTSLLVSDNRDEKSLASADSLYSPIYSAPDAREAFLSHAWYREVCIRELLYVDHPVDMKEGGGGGRRRVPPYLFSYSLQTSEFYLQALILDSPHTI